MIQGVLQVLQHYYQSLTFQMIINLTEWAVQIHGGWWR